MSLNKSSAISYNQGRSYSQQAILIIQEFVRTNLSGKWDNQSVQAVYDMQKSPYYSFKLGADGKVGPGTLGLIILELENAGRAGEAGVLRCYPYSIQGAPGEINIIETFTHWTSTSLKLETDGATWYSMEGVFNVKLKLSPSVPDPTRYEYRQKIKGEAWSHRGEWDIDPNDPTKEVWIPRGSWVDESAGFKVPAEGAIPKGLNKNNWKEDGEIVSGGKIERFGYRNQPKKISNGLLDFYSPDQNGYEYVLKDTFGIRRTTPYITAGKIWLELFYMGYVIDNQKPAGNQVIASKQWHYMREEILY